MPIARRMKGELSEADWLDALRRGDHQAFAAAIERCGDTIYHVAYRLLGSREEAEDILQETFLQAFQHLKDFRGEARLCTWLYRIAYNLALMRLRRKEPETISIDQPLVLEGDEEIPRELFDWCCLPEEELLRAELRSVLDEAIRSLPASLRTVFLLREVEGLSTEEVAQIMGISTDAVKARLHRARLQLRERLSRYFAEERMGR
ncbi:RNA polymerase sigma factor [Thermoflexus sp.]|uniref:RNA polymerase sigma factor n=1 Tax=Thermoflexus sp. TaxID=1969742 RepID=UPI0035E41055